MQHCALKRAVGLAMGVAVACAAQAAVINLPSQGEDDLVPTGKGWGERAQPTPGLGNGTGNGLANGRAKPTGSNGINYHGGPVLLGTPNIYYIWYGDWSGNTAGSILNNLASSIGGSPYFNINSTYYDGSNTHVSGFTTFASSTTDAYSRGTNLSDSDVQTVVSSAISAGKLPKDANAVYFVLTSQDVNETSGFCTQYCGWHTHGTIANTDIKYAFIGNPARCPSACTNGTPSPNNNVGADGMASIIAHELEEAVSDPDLNAWYDRRGMENADKCAWTFGTTYTTGNGGVANVKLGSLDYLIQRNWVNASGGYCSMTYP